jgi:3-oxoacyl-[acyl-carrier protein] reductase
MDLGIDGRVAVVTGGANERGVGWAVALSLAKEGVNVAVVDIIYENLVPLVEKIESIGRKSFAVKVDQGIYEEVQEAVAKIVTKFGKIDILVNNAAITSNMGSIRKMEPSKWVGELNVNLSGPYYWIREVLPIMYKRRWGRIVNISSIAGLVGALGMPSYSASKGGLSALARTAALDGASRGVLANTVTLGFVDTGIYEKNIERGLYDESTVEGMKKRVLLGRMGKPDEIADVVTFLCSEKASYITGANLLVEGGITLNVF